MKKISLVLSILLLNTLMGAYAGTYQNVFNAPARYEVSITGFYLQPGASNLVYAVHTEPLPITTPNWIQEYVDPNYHPAFNIGLAYHLNDEAEKLKIDWLHLDSSDYASANATGTASIAPPYYFGPLAQQLRGTFADSNAKFKVDNVNILLDHLFSISEVTHLTLFGGLGVAYLKEDITSSYSGVDGGGGGGGGPFSITSFNNSQFTGVGPRIGLTATRGIWKNMGLVAELATSLLVGSMNSETSFLSFGDGNITPARTSLAKQSQTRVVPELNAKLGLVLDKPLKSGKNWSLEGGYLFTTYLNGINQVVPTALVPNAFNQGIIAIESSGQVQSSMDLNGPYLKAKYRF
jgi:hypothetical protein